MKHRSRVEDRAQGPDVTVSFADHFQASSQFDTVFREGMDLVERTADYLDTQGRRDSKRLKPPISMAYASESMRLTTRLLDMASWLLIRRAVKAGEISEDEARVKRQRVKLQTIGRPSHIKHFDELPESLQDLICESSALYDRIVWLDRALTMPEADTEQAEGQATANPVGQQIDRLRQAFGH